MFHDSSRSAVLRRPQSGTPGPVSEHQIKRDALVGDAALLDLAVLSPAHSVLCGLLLRAQISTYRCTGHIISYADEYAMRKIRNHARRGTVPTMYCRCMRCGCLALLFDWLVACDLAADPLMAERRWPPGKRQVVDRSFFAECAGEDKMREALLLTD